MKTHKSVIVVLACLLGACGDETTPKDSGTKLYLESGVTDKSVTYNKGSFKVSIKSDTEWEAESLAGWLSVDTASGEGNKTVTISYTTASEARKGTVRFTGEGVDPVDVAVSQKAPEVLQNYVRLADPYILFHDDVYYAYGTTSDYGFEAYYSEDLMHWKKHTAWILEKGNSYGDKQFWAPEVYYNSTDKTFYLFYSAEQYVCVATSDSPLGPFKQNVKKPMSTVAGIDNTLFIDNDGKVYMYFCRFDNGLHINVVELESDYLTMKEGTEKECIRVSQDWERVWPTVNEGAYVIKRDGIYYLLYSANSYESPFYGIGYATSGSPLGPWTKSTNNPILQKPTANLVGTGHGAPFLDRDGKLRFVFHAHFDTNTIEPRKMYITDMAVTANGVTIDADKIISPKQVK